MAGKTPESGARDALTLAVLGQVASLNYAADWAIQLHLGSLRNANQHLFQKRWSDAGGNSIGDGVRDPDYKGGLIAWTRSNSFLAPSSITSTQRITQ